jgi:hypothetical protein
MKKIIAFALIAINIGACSKAPDRINAPVVPDTQIVEVTKEIIVKDTIAEKELEAVKRRYKTQVWINAGIVSVLLAAAIAFGWAFASHRLDWLAKAVASKDVKTKIDCYDTLNSDYNRINSENAVLQRDKERLQRGRNTAVDSNHSLLRENNNKNNTIASLNRNIVNLHQAVTNLESEKLSLQSGKRQLEEIIETDREDYNKLVRLYNNNKDRTLRMAEALRITRGEMFRDYGAPFRPSVSDEQAAYDEENQIQGIAENIFYTNEMAAHRKAEREADRLPRPNPELDLQLEYGTAD